MLELGFIFHFFSLSYSPLSIVLMCDGKATRRQFTSPIYLSIIVLSRREFFIVVKFCSSFNPLNLTASTTIKCLHHNWLMMFNQPNYSSPYGRPSIHPTIHPLLISLPFPSLCTATASLLPLPQSRNYNHYPFASTHMRNMQDVEWMVRHSNERWFSFP